MGQTILTPPAVSVIKAKSSEGPFPDSIAKNSGIEEVALDLSVDFCPLAPPPLTVI